MESRDQHIQVLTYKGSAVLGDASMYSYTPSPWISILNALYRVVLPGSSNTLAELLRGVFPTNYATLNLRFKRAKWKTGDVS